MILRPNKMAMVTFKHSISLPLSSGNRARMREERMTRKNVQLIREFLKNQRNQQTSKTKELAHLKKQRENKEIDKVTYDRLQKELMISHEMKQFQMLSSVTRRSAKMKN